MYSYGDGLVSGVPPKFLERTYKLGSASAQFYLPTNRSKAAVYYEYIDRNEYNSDGVLIGSSSTFYTTPNMDKAYSVASDGSPWSNPPIPAPIKTIVMILQSGGDTFTLEGNQDILWGKPYFTENTDQQGQTTLKLKYYHLASLQAANAGWTASGSGIDVPILWKYAADVMEEWTSVGSSPFSFNALDGFFGESGRLPMSLYGASTRFSSIKYTRDPNYRLVTQTITTASNLPTIREATTYAYTVYPGLKRVNPSTYNETTFVNRITEVAKKDVSELSSSGVNTFYRSMVTTWKQMGPNNLWYPYQSISWANNSTQTTIPLFSNWTTYAVPSGWQMSATNANYNSNGLVTQVLDGKGNTTNLIYGGGVTPCSEGAGDFRGAYLTCIHKPISGGVTLDLSWKLDYERKTGQVQKITNENDQVLSMFSFDEIGRIKEIRDGLNGLIKQYNYGVLGSITNNYIETILYPEAQARKSKAFFNGWGETLQSVTEISTSQSVVSASLLDALGRVVRQYKPYIAGSYSYQSSFQSDAATYYNGTNEPNAQGFPYTLNTFNNAGNILVSTAPGLNTGTQRSWSIPEKLRSLSGISNGVATADIISDEEKGLQFIFKDALGRAYLTRKFVESTISVPQNITLTAQVGNPGGGGSFQAAQTIIPKNKKSEKEIISAFEKKYSDEKLQGGKAVGGGQTGGVSALAEPGQSDIKTTSFTVTKPVLVYFKTDLYKPSSGLAQVILKENNNIEGYHSSETENSFFYGSGAFVAYPGINYTIQVEATMPQNSTDGAKAMIEIIFNKDGKILVPNDTRTNFDALGQITTVYPPLYFSPGSGTTTSTITTNYVYNTLGQLTQKSTPDAGTVKYKYDENGNIRYSQDANQAITNKYSYTVYDAFSRPTISGEASGTFSSLNPFGVPPSTETDPASSNILSIAIYDAKPISGTGFFATGKLLAPFNTKIQARTITYPKGQPVIRAYKVDKSANLWEVEVLSYNAKAQLETLYQASMLSSGVFRSDLTLSYSYNRLGEITQVSRFLGGDAWHEKYTYNTLGQTTAIQSDINTSNSPRITHTYNAAGQIKQTSFPRLTHSGTLGLNLPFTYTIRGWLLKIGDISNPANTSTSSLYPFQAQYTYSLTGNITEAIYRNSTSILGTATSPQYKYNFQYDKLNRLKAADFTSICILSSRRCGAIIAVDDQNATTTSLTLSHDLGNFTYDANGNLLSLHRRNQSGNTEDNLAYTYSQNRLTSLMDNAYNNLPGYATAWASFQYDANGNLTQVLDEVDYIPQFTAIYDVRNLPTAISHVTGGSASYRYNAAGQRIYKNVNGTAEHYVMNGSEPIAVLNADGTLRYWITSFGRAEKSGSSYVAYYYLKDHLGSTRVVMKEDGTRVEGYDYEPWGGIMPGRSYASGSNTKEKFTGKERDAESGLDYFGARYYHPGIGRWLAVDPMAEKYPAWSPYNYVMNNPLGMVDPDGRCPVPVQKEGDMYVCPQTLDGGEVEAISDETRRQRREYLAGGDYMLYGLGEGFVYMVGIGAGIYGGGAYLAGAGIETATTSLLTHRTVIQGSQIATEIMASEAGLVGVGGAAAVGAKQVAEEVVEEAVEVAGKTSNNLWKVGSYSEIKGLEVGLDAHHVGQKAVMKNFVSGYNLNTAPSILVPEVGHTIRGVNGIVSRSTSGFTNARQVLARDIFELRRVYGGQGIPNSSLQQLIQMNKTMYPGAFIK